MRKATYKQLVTVAAEFAEKTNCSYALAAKLYKVTEAEIIAFVEAIQSAAKDN
jgi:hypothetical protein